MSEVIDKSVLGALSTETRREIVKLLAKRPYTASEISGIMNKHVTTVTEHLNILEKAGLIKRKESGNKWVYYTLTDKGERIFKPAYYSWVIVLSVSTLFLLMGIQQIMITPIFYGNGAQVMQNDEASYISREGEKAVTQGEQLLATVNDTNITKTTMIHEDTDATTSTVEAIEQPATTYSLATIRIILGALLILISLLGFSYITVKKIRK